MAKFCYAASGNAAIHWRRLNDGRYGTGLQPFLDHIRALPTNQLWRHSVSGDLPGVNGRINGRVLRALVAANRGKRGFTYTHKPMTPANQAHVKAANAAGFTINLSADSPAMADELKALNVGPVVTVLPYTQKTNLKTAAGHTIVVCPATTHDDVTCASCKLCAWAGREVIIGFPAHGPFFKRIQVELPASPAQLNPANTLHSIAPAR